MRLLAFDKDGTPTLAVRRGDEIVDLSLAAPELPRDVPALLAAGAAAMERVGKIAFDPPPGSVRPAAGIRYWPPVWNAPKYLGAGLNYHDHAREQGVEPPKFPILFPRWAPSLVGHEEPLVCPLASNQFDWECELAVVIGRGGRHIARDDALQYEMLLKKHRTALAKLTTEVHSRFALSSSCLLFTLLGGPFAIVRGQRQFLTTFFVCFMPILLLYYPLMLGMMNLSKSGTVDPAWAMWISNVLLGIVAAFVLRRVLKH